MTSLTYKVIVKCPLCKQLSEGTNAKPGILYQYCQKCFELVRRNSHSESKELSVIFNNHLNSNGA